MSGAAELSSVAYKKGNWMRYLLWGLAAVCIGLLIYTFISTMNGKISASVPEGYKFAVTDNYTDGSRVRKTYYVYDDKILVESESLNNDSLDRAVMVYDGVKTDNLKYDAEDVTEVCVDGNCTSKPKIIAVIKNLISHKAGREYLGL